MFCEAESKYAISTVNQDRTSFTATKSFMILPPDCVRQVAYVGIWWFTILIFERVCLVSTETIVSSVCAKPRWPKRWTVRGTHLVMAFVHFCLLPMRNPSHLLLSRQNLSLSMSAKSLLTHPVHRMLSLFVDNTHRKALRSLFDTHSFYGSYVFSYVCRTELVLRASFIQ